MRLNHIAGLAIAGLLVAGQSNAQQRWTTLDDYLVRGVGLTRPQLAALAKGETVAKLLPTGDDHDVAAFAVVQVDVPRSFFIERQRDLPRALQIPSRRQVQLFSSPAIDGDVRALEITNDDIKELRACRPNDCNFKLPATDMDQVRAIDLTGPAATQRVAAYARRRILDYVADYRRRGNAAMLVYDDRGSVRSSDALAAMMRDSTYTFRVLPSLGAFVGGDSRGALPDATEAIFWSIDELPHVRAVLRITHQTVYSPPEIPGTTVMAAKQIYANHYFEAGLELLTALDRIDAKGGITLVAVRRYRFDNLPSGGPLKLGGRVRDGLRDNVLADLTRLKRESETAWRSAH